MSRTVSFRCSEELDEYLEQEAERRMTTKSTVAQMIVAEYFRENIEDSGENGDLDEPSVSGGSGDGDSGDSGGSGDSGDGGGLSREEILEKHSEHWYESSGDKNDYAVRSPDRDPDYRRYYKTKLGVANRLEELYE